MVIDNDELHIKFDIKNICPRRYLIWLLLFAMTMFGQWQLLSGVRGIKKNYWDAIGQIEENFNNRIDFMQTTIEKTNNVQDLESSLLGYTKNIEVLNKKLDNHYHTLFGKIRFRK